MTKRVVGRKVVGRGSSTPTKDRSLDRILEKVELVEADNKVALFKKKPTPLTPSQKEFNKCVEILTQINNDDKSKEGMNDISTRELCSFFSLSYYKIYQFNCIDYNYFNAKTTFENLKNNFNLETNIDVMLLLCKTIDMFSQVKQSLNLKDDVPTLSTFKQRWIIGEVISPSGKFEGFY